MKNLIYLLLVVFSLTSCIDSNNMKIISTSEKVNIIGRETTLYKKGDTVQLRTIGNRSSSWSLITIWYSKPIDTSYIFRNNLVIYKRAVVE